METEVDDLLVLCFFPCSAHKHSRVSPLRGSVDMMIEVRGTGVPFESVHPYEHKEHV